MKHSKRLTFYEKILLKANGHDPSDYLRTKRVNKDYEFVNRVTGESLHIEDVKR